MTKAEIENYLNDEFLLYNTCRQLVENMKIICLVDGDREFLSVLNRYSPDEYIEFARKNLKDKLSKL